METSRAELLPSCQSLCPKGKAANVTCRECDYLPLDGGAEKPDNGGGGRAVQSNFDNFTTLLMKETPVMHRRTGFSANRTSARECDFRGNGQASEEIADDGGNVGLATRRNTPRGVKNSTSGTIQSEQGKQKGESLCRHFKMTISLRIPA